MDTKVQTLVESAQELPLLEQLNLISLLFQSLQRRYRQLQPATDFWRPQTLEQLAQAQQVRPVTNIVELKAGFWPEDESADDLIEYIYWQRRQDRLRY